MKDEEDEKEEHHEHDLTPGTDAINGQIAADREFTQKAEELLAKLRSGKKPPGEEPKPPGEKTTRDVTSKHK